MLSVCNRTYYGDIGRTYSIQVPTPQWNKMPFLCHLTFTASGHQQGDIVQVNFLEQQNFRFVIFTRKLKFSQKLFPQSNKFVQK